MDKFNDIVKKILKIDPKDLRDDLTSKDIPDWDSMNYLMFIAELEKEFNVTFSMDETFAADSVGGIKKLLREKGVSL